MTILHIITVTVIAVSLNFSGLRSDIPSSGLQLPSPIYLGLHTLSSTSVPLLTENPESTISSLSSPTTTLSPISNRVECGLLETGRMGPCGRAGCSGRDQYCTSYIVFNFLGFTLYRHCTGTLQSIHS